MNAEAVALQRILARARASEKKADDAREAARAIPAFLEWEQKRDSLRFQIARCKAINADYGELEKQLEDTKAQLEHVMAEHGINENDFMPVCTCTRCHDTGYVMGAPCDCLKEEMYRILQEDSGVLATKEFGFDHLADALPDDATKTRYAKCYRILSEYNEKFPTVPRYLILGGAPSTGKTYALNVLANALMRRGFSTLSISAYRMNQTFLEYHLAPLERKNEILQPLLDVDFLMIDDLGTEPQLQNVTVPYLLMLLGLRTNPTAVTTNLNAEHLTERYGDRIMARLLARDQSKAILLTGYDFRLKMN